MVQCVSLVLGVTVDHPCVCVSVWVHTSIHVCVAMLPSLVLHRTSVRPYQRGLYCSDSSLRYPYKSSTVPSSVLTSVGLTLPAVSVSHPPPPTHKGHSMLGERQKRGGLVVHDGLCEGVTVLNESRIS